MHTNIMTKYIFIAWLIKTITITTDNVQNVGCTDVLFPFVLPVQFKYKNGH